MTKTKTIADMVNEYIDPLPVGTTFHPRQISDHIYLLTGGMRHPLSGTVGRYIRYRKEAKHDVKLHSRDRSEYIRTEPMDTEDDAEDETTCSEAAEHALRALLKSLHKDGYGLDDAKALTIRTMLEEALEGEVK